MGLGGPVWHASVALTPLNEMRTVLRSSERNGWTKTQIHNATHRMLLAQANRVLISCGDAALGQWVEHLQGSRVLHMRRRLSAQEEARVGPVRDLRGTAEWDARLDRVKEILGPRYDDIIHEMGGPA